MDDLKNQIINKAGFLIYSDYWEKYFSKMTGDQVKEVFKIIFHFNLTFEVLKTDDLAIEMVVATIIDNLKRDAMKRAKQAIASAENGKLGGRPKKKQKVANASKSKQKIANLADSDSKSKNESKNDLPIFINKNLFNGFVEMRKKIKKPLTEHAKELLIKKLTEFENKQAGFANKALENSIESSWQGVFEPKQNNFNNNFNNNQQQKPMGMPKPNYNDPNYYLDRGDWDD